MWNRALPLFASLLALTLLMPACSEADRRPQGPSEAAETPKLMLSPALEPRRAEFGASVRKSTGIVRKFAGRRGWDSLAAEPFMDSVMVFDDKRTFDRTLLSLVGADTSTKLPAGYCAALERRTMVVVTPEFYARVYPEGVEDGSYAKLLAHEMAHRLHIRILKGDEEAMGPIWFYEGFAVHAADQFVGQMQELGLDEVREITGCSDRGNYRDYRRVLEHYLKKALLSELIARAGGQGFDEWLRSLDEK